MAHHHDSSSPLEAESLKAGYELTDASAKQISMSSLAIFATVFAGMLGMFVLIKGFLYFQPVMDRVPTQAEYQRTLPPAPRLQVDQSGDLVQFRVREEESVSTWQRNPNSGAVRMPVDKAIEIIAGRGTLPGSRTAAPGAAAAKPVPAPAAGGGTAPRR